MPRTVFAAPRSTQLLLLAACIQLSSAWVLNGGAPGVLATRRAVARRSSDAAAAAAADSKRRVLILISDTGGGHRASAQAVEAAMHDMQPDLDISVVDMWTDYTPWPYNTFVDGYKLAAKIPPIWSAVYFSTMVKPFFALLNLIGTLICYDGVRACIEKYDPELVVSMHPLCQDIPLTVLGDLAAERGAARVPFATVVTDLGSAHQTWFRPGADACFVPSDAVRAVALEHGLGARQLRQYGLPVRKDFYAPPPYTREGLAAELGVEQGRKTVLLVGGGDGVGSLGDIVPAMAAELGASCRDEAQMVVVCGKNAALRERLQSQSYDGVRVQVEGFVRNMPEWMALADCLVTKAGPGTIAEAAIRGVPTMLSSFLPGQEAGNVAFVTEQGFGAYSPEPEAIARHVASWLRQPELLAQMSARARAAAAPQATTQIAHDLLRMLEGEALQPVS